MTTFYTDLSHHDWNRAKGEMNFAKIKGETSGCVVVRATYGDPEGTHYATQHFGDMIKQAKAAGFTLLGGYHNLVRGDLASIKRQVAWFRSELDKYGCNWAMVDIERFDELMENGQYPRWDDVQQFHDEWYRVDKRVLAWYLPDWVWQASLGSHSLTGLKGPLVASEYGSNPSDGSAANLYAKQGGDTSTKWHSYGGRVPEILQFGSNFVCDGASSHTDVDAFRGTFAQLTKLLIPTTPEPTPPQEDGMEQKDKLLYDTGNPDRTVGQQMADDQNLRNYEVSPASQTSKLNPPADSRIVQLHANAAKVPAIAEDVAGLKTAVADLTTNVNKILGILEANGGQVPTTVDLTDASVAKVADAVVDEEQSRLAE